MVLHGDNNTVHGHAQLFRGGLDDADIGLMRHDPVNIIVRRAPLLSSAVSAVLASFSTAWRNTSLPCIRNMPVFWVDTPPST